MAAPDESLSFVSLIILVCISNDRIWSINFTNGLVHISELADKRVAKVGDVVKEGDQVSVKVVGFDRGKVKLSMKQASK